MPQPTPLSSLATEPPEVAVFGRAIHAPPLRSVKNTIEPVASVDHIELMLVLIVVGFQAGSSNICSVAPVLPTLQKLANNRFSTKPIRAGQVFSFAMPTAGSTVTR